MSKLEQIATFICVVEEQGFAAAARKKSISTAAVSRQVTALERELGTQLLQRTTRHIALTDVGAEYYQQCKSTLSALNEAEAAIVQSKNEATGTLTVMAIHYFAIKHILPTLPEFMRLNPKLCINLQLAENFPNLEKEGVDILFGVSVEGSDELVRRRVTTTRYVLCASPDYLKKHGTPKAPIDLTQHQYITHTMRKPNTSLVFKDGYAIQLNPMLFLNDTHAMRECAINGLGIVNLHDYMVLDALKNGQLVEILADYQEPKKNVYLYYRQSRHLQPKIRRFIDFYAIE